MKQDGQVITQLGMRNPVSIIGAFDGPNDFDVYVEDDRTNDQGLKSPKPDGKQKQGPTWQADSHMDFTAGFAADIWTIRDTPRGDYRVYYKMVKQADGHQPTHVVGTIMLSLDPSVVLPVVTLTDEGQVVRAATITTTDDGHAKVHIDVPGAQQNSQ